MATKEIKIITREEVEKVCDQLIDQGRQTHVAINFSITLPGIWLVKS